MSNTPNPNRKPKTLGRSLAVWLYAGRVWTVRGSMSVADYELLRAARPADLPAVADLPVKGRHATTGEKMRELAAANANLTERVAELEDALARTDAELTEDDAIIEALKRVE